MYFTYWIITKNPALTCLINVLFLDCILQQGGLGGLKYPLLADFTKNISRDYGVLVEEAGLALRLIMFLFVLSYKCKENA